MKPRIYILCNGERAEPQYFQDFKDHLKAHNIIVKHKKEFRRKSPWAFIEAAISFKEEEEKKGSYSQEDGDEMWCVFDVDNFWEDNEPKFREALKMAEEHKIKVAHSNECFEFWFLCHFGLHNISLARTEYHKKLNKDFKAHSLGEYKKNMKGIFQKIHPFHASAISNARKLYKPSEIHKNPSTGVFLVVESMLGSN